MRLDLLSDNWLQIISGGLTMFTILTGVSVLVFFHKSVWQSLRSNQPFTNSQLLMLGVYCGFLGQVSDNSYWEITWTYDFFAPDSAVRAWLFSHGVKFNIPFRQILGSLAAYFHIKAALVTTESGDKKLAIILWAFAGLSTVYAAMKFLAYLYLIS